jgi:GTP cyclohydrolase I
MTERMKAKIVEYLQNNQEALAGAFTIWAEMYTLKMDIVSQLNKAAEASPVQGYLQDGTNTHEGFVANGLKFVDRMGFSRQNLAGR